MRTINSILYDEKYFRHSGGSKYFLKDKVAPIYYQAIKRGNLDRRKYMTFLDIGCGRGDLIKALLSKFKEPHIIGIDYSDVAVRITKKWCGEKRNAKIIKCDAAFLPLKDSMVDCVFLIDLVEHLYPEHLNKVIKEAHRVMKPKSKLVIHTFPTKYINNVARFILKLLNKSSSGQKLHVNTQTYFSIQHLLLDNHFENIQIFLEGRNNLLHDNIDTESHFMKILLKTGDVFYSIIVKVLNFFPFKYFLLSDIWVIAEKR